ncbi:YqhG family protein [Thalassobacillus devorans]|uniref:YqhG family protein n=1 Tax=Thalassobacillus devorans TaxID=279813 RepID=UPI00048C896A|nr:YqhG family protein [Thalassobacillus devorans]
MKEAAAHEQFIRSFFYEYECPIVSDENGRLVVQLTDKMDEALMNRPFYWHYIKKMGRQGDPMSLTLITNPELTEEKGEYIHSGSPRLRQLYRYLLENCRYTKLYEAVQRFNQQSPLVPWLIVNIRVSYYGKQKKDEILSIGLNLIHGTMVSPIMEKLEKYQLETTISDYTFPMTPLIRIPSGYQRILSFIHDHIESTDRTWANKALETLEEEEQLLHAFFQKDDDEEREFMEKELEGLKGRFTPRVTVDVLNGGLFYLTQETTNELIK